MYFFVVKITIMLFKSTFFFGRKGMPISSDTLGVPQTASQMPMLISQPWGGGGGGFSGELDLIHFFLYFYPQSPEVEPWVNRWTFSPSSPPSSSSPSSHFQLFVSLRYRKRQFSNWFDFPGNSGDSYHFLLLLLLFPGAFLSGELSTLVWRTVHRPQAVQ